MRILDEMARFARSTAESARDFGSVIHNLVMDLRDSYRPEVHCLRGPGPKRRAKHQPWPAFDLQTMLPAARHQLSRVHVRRRDAANTTR